MIVVHIIVISAQPILDKYTVISLKKNPFIGTVHFLHVTLPFNLDIMCVTTLLEY